MGKAGFKCLEGINVNSSNDQKDKYQRMIFE